MIRWFVLACAFIPHLFLLAESTELTFELPDNEKQCFYEPVENDERFHIDFQVIAGGNYDVDCLVMDPEGKVLYQGVKKQYDTFSHTATMSGDYKVCFSNEFSTFSHKTVYLDLRTREERPLLPVMNSVAALTQLESTCLSIHEILKVVVDSQTRLRLREATDRIRAELLHDRVAYWSLGETAVLLAVSLGQVLILRSFFSDKKKSVGT